MLSTTATSQGRRWRFSGSIQPRTGWKPQPHWLVDVWLKLVEPARGCPLGQRRGPIAPGEDIVSSPGQNSFHTFTTPTAGGRKRRYAGPISSRTVWKPQSHWLSADWLVLTESTRGCPSGQHRGPVAPGEDNVSSGSKYFQHFTTPTIRGRKCRSPGSIPLCTVWKPQPH